MAENLTKVIDKKKINKEETKKKLEHNRERDREKVRGIFRYNEVPGGALNFVFKVYDGDQVERYDLVDGQVYELPLGVARHLNTNVWYPNHSYLLDKDGKPQMHMTKKVRRATFQSLEFTDINEFQSDADIVTARPL